MLVTPAERDSYLHFIELNTALWRIEDTALDNVSAERIVIVDLLSHDLHQALRALYVGKILQRQMQCRIVGLVGNLLFSRDLDFRYEKREAVRLARSYGVTEFVDLEDSGPKDLSDTQRYITPAQTQAAIASLRACDDDNLSDLVLGWRAASGCRIGEYIYETTLRIARNPFLKDVRAKLEEVTCETHRIHNIIVAQCGRGHVGAFTAGHISYTQWGMVADLVLRNSGKVVWFDCTGNFSAYMLARPPREDETLSGMVREIDRPLFEREFQERGHLSDRFVSKVQQLFSSDYFLRPFWFEPTKSPPKPLVPLLRNIALSKLGWPDAQCPVICIFFHCLADLPRDDEQIYLDYYVWIEETLKIATRDTSRKWIFKTHPANWGGYDVTNATERLKAAYADHEHIFFLEDELEKVEVFAVCDLAVTVRGSIAYEMSVFGKPALLAGRSILSDLGFCHVAKSAEEYEAFLTRDLASLALTHDMQQRADFYLIYDKVACRIESTFMPYWTYRLTGDANIWDALSERILYNISDLDPVVSAMQAMLEGGPARTLNPRYHALANSSRIEQVDFASHGPDLTRARGTEITFARESNDLPLLLTKPERSDDQGSWFSAEQEALIGFVARGTTPSDRGPVGIQFQFSGPPEDCLLNISANGGAIERIALQGGGRQSELIDLKIDATSPEEPIVLRVWLSKATGEKLYLGLHSIKVDTMQRLQPPKPGILGTVNRLFERFGS